MTKHKNVQNDQKVHLANPATADLSDAGESQPISITCGSTQNPGEGEPSGWSGPRWQSHDFRSGDTWAPAVNVYQYPHMLVLCMELAGVVKSEIEVEIEPGKLVIRGQRQPPYHPQVNTPPLRLLNMEIEHGRFVRALVLPDQVDLARVASQYKDGLLWVELPLLSSGA